MQRVATKQSRGAHPKEREFIVLVKQLPCCCCGQPGPSIFDHVWGSSKKLYLNNIERVHVGHYAGIPLCTMCDAVKTRGSRREFEDQFGNQIWLWLRMVSANNFNVPEKVIQVMEQEFRK